ncbi:uncharacterized protein B0J16DRAFT_414077 [Fusarium flagelliforme]|uniref:uncharacterized protein n=1 Tax=Fusarium flagelliforme TaxID=2675880 RepID=UPI001E8D318D|nr:uncharacterized protein B0J16DRAFT_414077 [Fusarium flagelliforme]KAH7184588.1 hypothetical protein B0J16DRAFT_414077 [Fusarium flagelliforme]
MMIKISITPEMSSKRNVGPLDKRKKLTRCQPCAKRRIKCQGGSPCEYCIRTKKTCLPQNNPVVKAKFVYTDSSQIMAHVTAKPDVTYLEFFSLFMRRCQFTRASADLASDLLPLIQTCAPLQEAAIAIGALEASRRATVNFTSERQSPEIIALQSYGRSIRRLQAELDTLEASQCQGVLWCTLLLGLFDLMTQVSGDQWAKHMLYGTSRIVQTFGMTRPVNHLGKQFLAAFNWLEANRAILYCEETILSQGEWGCQYRYPTPPLTSQVDSIFELFLQVSSFSKFFFDCIESIPESRRVYDTDISHLGCEGRAHQQRLQDWHSQYLGDTEYGDVYCKLELAISHALQLLICMNYTFYTCWDEVTIPRLNTSETESHVSAILCYAGQIVDSSIIPGLLMLFPLRMAGANTNDRSQKDRILRLLERISQTGFIVSNRITVDLEEVWAYKALCSIGQ